MRKYLKARVSTSLLPLVVIGTVAAISIISAIISVTQLAQTDQTITTEAGFQICKVRSKCEAACGVPCKKCTNQAFRYYCPNQSPTSPVPTNVPGCSKAGTCCPNGKTCVVNGWGDTTCSGSRCTQQGCNNVGSCCSNGFKCVVNGWGDRTCSGAACNQPTQPIPTPTTYRPGPQPCRARGDHWGVNESSCYTDGWAQGDGGEQVSVNLYVDDKFKGSFPANLPGGKDNNTMFNINLRPFIPATDTSKHSIRIKTYTTCEEEWTLPNSPKDMSCWPPPGF